MFESLTPIQKTALAAGVPLVGLAVLWNNRRGAPVPEAEAPVAEPPAGVLPAGQVASTDAIGTGTLAQWSTLLTDSMSGLSTRIADLETKGSTPPPPAPKPPANTVHQTMTKAGETVNAVATRLRAAGQLTADGRPLTAAWLIHTNKLKATGTTVLKTGTILSY